MSKRTLLILVALAVILPASYLRWLGPANQALTTPFDYRNETFMVGETRVQLTEGVSRIQGDAGASDVTTTAVFGNEAIGDVDGDGVADVAFIMTQNYGGSGTFFSVAVALAADRGEHAVEWFLLGDRIRPQSTEIRDGVIIVNFSEHAPGEALGQNPTQGSTVRLTVQNGRLLPLP